MNDNEQRDELARDVMNAYYEASDGSGSRHWVEMADILYAAGYRQPRTITAVEERDALREGSVVRDKDGDVIERLWGGWYFGDNNTVPNLPATVLHEPTT